MSGHSDARLALTPKPFLGEAAGVAPSSASPVMTVCWDAARRRRACRSLWDVAISSEAVRASPLKRSAGRPVATGSACVQLRVK